MLEKGVTLQSILKKSSTMHVSYSNGGFTDLWGRDVKAETSDEVVRLSVDLSENYNVKNRESDCISDIQQFVEWHEKLTLLQMMHEDIASALRDIQAQHPVAEWKLCVQVGKLGNFEYNVAFERGDFCCFLEVLASLPCD